MKPVENVSLEIFSTSRFTALATDYTVACRRNSGAYQANSRMKLKSSDIKRTAEG
jgi:hypothetical protein